MSYLTSAQIRSMTTADLALHYGAGFTIEVARSVHNDIPCIIFRSISRGLVAALGTHHAHKLQKMQSTWKQWTSGARADKLSDGLFYNVISLKGLRPSTLKAWIAAAQGKGFVVNIADNVFWSKRAVTDIQATTVVAETTTDIWEESTATVATEVVDCIPVEATVIHQINGKPAYPQLNPIQARVMSLTTKEMKDYLRANGEKVGGSKAVLRDRVMQTI
jgi:hypothetical protein